MVKKGVMQFLINRKPLCTFQSPLGEKWRRTRVRMDSFLNGVSFLRLKSGLSTQRGRRFSGRNKMMKLQKEVLYN